MGPDILSLRYFLVVAEERHFTRAAVRIGIAQPALSARIRRLEADLGTQLLVRTTRTVELTPAGTALVESAPAALAAVDRAFDAARRIGAGAAGPLRIGYSLSAGAETAPMLVDALVRALPGLDVTAAPMPTPEISPAVAEGRLDVGITRAEQPGRGVRRFPLRQQRIGVQLAADHPLAANAEIDVADLAGYPVQLHERAANPVAHDQLVGLLGAGPVPRFHSPIVAFDLSQRVVRSGAAVSLAGEAALSAHPPGLTWRPLRTAAVLTTCLVLPYTLLPMHQRVRLVAKDLAAETNWLNGTAATETGSTGDS
ncbi:LysR family transcriptional regulator [Nocardia stercoris]|uniref:LysR family transcriptional regulator n=1 Tax=Nocardia stercoris TaxID=2483361 RepID=A0A3M2KZM0_9NOCA|nr:LysR family transcriptional regulator [Nocardia stercoris]